MTQAMLAPYLGPPTLQDLYEILRIPILFALIAIAGTWVVWYLTSTSCTTDLAASTGCNASLTARYINVEVLNKIVTHAVIAGGGGGLWSYAMITRERKAREALEKLLAEERERATEERERATQERERAAEERERAAEERRQLLATIENLMERLAEQQNGGTVQSQP